VIKAAKVQSRPLEPTSEKVPGFVVRCDGKDCQHHEIQYPGQKPKLIAGLEAAGWWLTRERQFCPGCSTI